MLTHAVDLRDRRTGLEQAPRRRLLVRKGYSAGRRRQQRRAAPGKEHQQMVLRLEAASDLEGTIGRLDAVRVGIGVAGLDQLDALTPSDGRGHVAVAADDE